MAFRKFQQNKLWRDKNIGRLEEQGSIIHWKQLDDTEFAEQLRIKFLEEAQEVCAAVTKEQLIEELADILEVISSLCDVHQFTFQDIQNAQNKKRETSGDFNNRKFITYAEHKVGSFGERYCLKDPNKYPEILD